MNLLPVIQIPEVHALKKPSCLLYYYDIETKGDLARLMRYLLFTGVMSLSLYMVNVKPYSKPVITFIA